MYVRDDGDFFAEEKLPGGCLGSLSGVVVLPAAFELGGEVR